MDSTKHQLSSCTHRLNLSFFCHDRAEIRSGTNLYIIIIIIIIIIIYYYYFYYYNHYYFFYYYYYSNSCFAEEPLTAQLA